MIRTLVLALLMLPIFVSTPLSAEARCDFTSPIGSLRRFYERNRARIDKCDQYGEFSGTQLNCFHNRLRINSLAAIATSTEDLNWKAEAMFFEEFAQNSRAQAACRVRYFNSIFKSGDVRQKMNDRASARFDQIKRTVKALLTHRAELDRERQGWENAANSTAGRGGTDLRKSANVYATWVAETDDVIFKTLMSIPMGHEPEVSDELRRMAATGRFDAMAYQQAISRASEKYRRTVTYFDGLRDGDTFCLDDSFRRTAGRTGAIRNAVAALPNDTPALAQFQRRLGCRLDAQYETGPRKFSRDVLIASVLSMGAGGAANAVGRGALLARAWWTASNVAIDMAYLAITTERVRRDCLPGNAYLMAPQRTCNPEAELRADEVRRSLPLCALDLTWGAWSSVTLPNHVARYLRTAR